MAGLTMSALADHAGMSRGNVYHYFPDIDAVLAAWVGRDIQRSVSRIVAGARGIEDPVERLGYLIDVQVRAFASQKHRLSAEHFESEAGAPVVRREVEAQMAPLRRVLADTIGEAQASGGMRRGVEPALAADLLLGLLGASRRHLIAGAVDPEHAAAAITGLIDAGWVVSPTTSATRWSGTAPG